ncbi:TIGR02328 family protein [Paenibacillus sp. PDC88]|uniref:TIGR02328 family protein n=1 Tax=Paenibacillus sp. PDC88 TaxID=1884375 RepID=UPI000896D231|nr:TIGR02328 family protein [Paenibacillus sp. PDC88]SDW82149.1 Pyrimidine dimer DNA glycosylase /DNA-(apurinic or apyrimidinic site) lyase [Paenibacillus sp. PDC88]
MRLWHEDLIRVLPRPQLLGQHRECCALRGGGWGKKHATVNYVFDYHPLKLVRYHILIMEEMKNRGYNVDSLWENPAYRGKQTDSWDWAEAYDVMSHARYDEHDDVYLKECLDNLAEKGIILEMGVK